MVTVYGEFFSEPNSSRHKMTGGFKNPCALYLGFMKLEVLLGLLNPRIDKKKCDVWIYWKLYDDS